MRWIIGGLVGAAVLAGPPLHALVEEGSLDAGNALLRGGVVAAVIAAGLALIGSLINSYRADLDATSEDGEDAEDAEPEDLTAGEGDGGTRA